MANVTIFIRIFWVIENEDIFKTISGLLNQNLWAGGSAVCLAHQVNFNAPSSLSYIATPVSILMAEEVFHHVGIPQITYLFS